MKNPGVFLISLDFELFWGVRDRIPEKRCRDRLQKVHAIVPRLIELFKRYDIHATFATVGMLMVRDLDELKQFTPETKPEYLDKRLSPYNGYLKNINGHNADLHFAPDLVSQIAQAPGLEIGSHTFSHYYCLANGQDADSFQHDLEAHLRLAKNQGVDLKSLVFPRNQYNVQYLEICRKYGFKSYRGNESSWIYAARDDTKETSFRRALRLADAYLNISGHHTYSPVKVGSSIPFNFPSSRFLRPANKKTDWLEEMRLKRITSAMNHAANHGEIYHLWWHPHNFGEHTEANFEFLEKILQHYQNLSSSHHFKSMNMIELADYVEQLEVCQ